MKTVKLTVLALFMVLTNLVCAQESEMKKISTEEKVKVETKDLTQKLNLTPAQEKTAGSAILQRIQQQEADKEKFKGDKEGLKEAHKTNNQSFEKTIKGLLTADQLKKYEQMLVEKL
ncbi:MAG TPA: hypothetical protein VNX01_16085 [Bacteroidia bacterium]|jgi:hypothetical protein|nr:hypothetical protein [Bacteroidia bacterium]